MNNEELASLYERIKQVVIAKHGVTLDTIELEEDGNFRATRTIYSYGEYNTDYYSVGLEELTADLDELVAERKEKERVARIETEERYKEQERLRLQRKEEEERREYRRLQDKFGK